VLLALGLVFTVQKLIRTFVDHLANVFV